METFEVDIQISKDENYLTIVVMLPLDDLDFQASNIFKNQFIEGLADSLENVNGR